MMSHTIPVREIMALPAGQIMNTLINEHVCGNPPLRSHPSKRTPEPLGWFTPLPRQTAYDDRHDSLAQLTPEYSRYESLAMKLKDQRPLTGRTLQVVVETTQAWASFSGVPFERRTNSTWASADTLPLAICRAALLETRA